MTKKFKEISNGVNEYFLESLKEEGKRLEIPPNKNRALIREYLQSKIIYYLYEEQEAKNLSFIGGTSLRILRNLDRFSEDLDFDNLGLSFSTIKKLFAKIKAILTRRDLQPRDFYDVVWFLSHKIKPDKKLFPEMGVKNESELFLKLKDIYLKKVKPNLKNFKKRLAPFLIEEKKIVYLDLFEKAIIS